MANDVEREPLDLSVFSENLKQHVSPDAPAKMKMMAAQGMVPAPPAETVRLLYQLQFEASDQVQAEIDSAIGDMPENVLAGVVEDEDHAGVLDWVAEKRGDSQTIVETLLRNQATEDMTVAGLAERAGAEICDIIATNEVRVLETPQIIEELYQNPNARMATVDQLIELAQRNDVDLDGLPGVSRAVQSETDLTHEDDEEGISDEQFRDLLEEQHEQAEEEEELLAQLEDEDLTRSQREKLREEIEEKLDDDDEEEGDEDDRGVLTHGDLMQMDVPQKIRLATVGSRSAVKKLVQDSNKLVHMAAIESPRLKTPDAKQFAARKSMPDDVLSFIANNREWTQNYEVVKNLVFNPKTPVSDSMELLKRLRKNDLQQLEDSREVPHQISRAAKRLLKKRRGR
jgi:hypothetical protein